MPDGHPLLPQDPAELGGNRLVGRLGEGSQGVVYLGLSPAGEHVAIKLLHARMAEDPGARERFVHELSAAKKVARFCTAQVLDADLAGDHPYIVSEYVEGRPLRSVILDAGPRTGGALERLAIGTLTALAAIHRAGIVHRDFTPHNVLLGPDGPRVIDFGIARALGAAGFADTGSVGTPAYMAPEQVSGRRVGPSADMFAWGATILFAATGHPPFGNESVHAVMERIVHDEPDVSVLPEPLRSVVAACLAKDPARRPTAQQAQADLLDHEATARFEDELMPPPAFGAIAPPPAGPTTGPTSQPSVDAATPAVPTALRIPASTPPPPPAAGPPVRQAPIAPARPPVTAVPVARATTDSTVADRAGDASSGPAPRSPVPPLAAKGPGGRGVVPGDAGSAGDGPAGAPGKARARSALTPASTSVVERRRPRIRWAVLAGAGVVVAGAAVAVPLWPNGGDAATSPRVRVAAAPATPTPAPTPTEVTPGPHLNGVRAGATTATPKKHAKHPAKGCHDYRRAYPVGHAGSVSLTVSVCREAYSGDAVLSDTAPKDGWSVCVQLRGHVTGADPTYISTILSSGDGRVRAFGNGPRTRFGAKTTRTEDFVGVNVGRCKGSGAHISTSWQTHDQLAAG
jgi:Protein kinase domain